MAYNADPRTVNFGFAVETNHDLCTQFGGTPGLRWENGLRYALAVPRLTVFGELAYPTLALQAAKMIESIVCGHVFVDGNKRTAWNLAIFFCASNGWLLDPDYPEGARDAVVALITKKMSVEGLAAYINDNLFQ